MKEQKKTKYFFSQYAYHQFYSILYFFPSSGGGSGHFEDHTGDTKFVLERSLSARLLSTVITS